MVNETFQLRNCDAVMAAKDAVARFPRWGGLCLQVAAVAAVVHVFLAFPGENAWGRRRFLTPTIYRSFCSWSNACFWRRLRRSPLHTRRCTGGHAVFPPVQERAREMAAQRRPPCKFAIPAEAMFSNRAPCRRD